MTDIQLTRADLISLDSPFITDPPEIQSEVDLDFESIWNGLEGSDMRGWCEVPMDAVLRRLQHLQHRLSVTPVDQPPFESTYLS